MRLLMGMIEGLVGLSFLACVLGVLVWPLMHYILKPYGLPWTFSQSVCLGAVGLILAVLITVLRNITERDKSNGHRRFSS